MGFKLYTPTYDELRIMHTKMICPMYPHKYKCPCILLHTSHKFICIDETRGKCAINIKLLLIVENILKKFEDRMDY